MVNIFTLLYFILIIFYSFKRPISGIVLSSNAYLINALISKISENSNFSLISITIPLLCFSIILIRIILATKLRFIYFNRIDLIFIVITFWFLFSTIFSVNMTASLVYVMRFIFLGLSFYVITVLSEKLYLDKSKIFEDFIYGFLISGILMAATALYYFESSSEYIMRLTIGNAHSIPLSIILGASILSIFYYLLTPTMNNIKYLFIIIFMPVFYALLLTNTRGALIAVLISFTVYLITSRQVDLLKSKSFFLMLLSIFISSFIYITSTNNTLTYRLISGFERLATRNLGQSETGRINAWSESFNIFLDNLLVGVGPGGFDYIYKMYTHNIFLESLVDTGIIGFLLVFLLLLVSLLTHLSLKHSYKAIIIAFLFFAIIISLVSLTFWMHKILFISIAMVSIGLNIKCVNNNIT